MKVRPFLTPLTVPLRGVLAARHFLYDRGWLPVWRPDLPVIGVGNLNLGGAGKTPFTEYLVRLLLDRGIPTAVLSRGYKRRSKGFRLARPDSALEELGDEPWQMWRKFSGDSRFCLAVDADRRRGIRRLQDICRPRVIVMDDAFQHRRVEPGLQILLTPFHRPFTRDRLFPAGTLRDLPSRAAAASVIVVTKTPEGQEHRKAELRRELEKFGKPVFFSSLEYDLPRTDKGGVKWDELRASPVLAVTGIADPQPFYDALSAKNINFVRFTFPDHAAYGPARAEKIRRAAERIGARWIVTTEKDYHKLRPYGLPLAYVPVKMRVENEHLFNQKILHYVDTRKFI
ncbi:MAG: tetraacyldisaccharide 4'-kinase [Chlorobi bacterium]|nr:tetraacyldisaccharide 4'-kinase [Chlorobiota bacterium]